MECKDKKTAQRVALFGALKMTEQGYTFEPWGAGGTVRRPDGRGYFVCLPGEGEDGVSANCICKFFQKNWEHAVCKHTVWAVWQAKALAKEAERQAEEDRIEMAATAFMERLYGEEAMESDYLTRNFG